MPVQVEISSVSGESLRDMVPELARLRVAVFRAWPYLYDGDEAYEAAYLQTYVRSPRAAVIVARAQARIVGASTCLPLSDETENVTAPFRAKGWDTDRFFYFGESVLLPELRGQGLGVAFFAGRERHARAVSSCDYATFCAVQRPTDHPARPAGYQPLDTFWAHRGFVKRPDLTCEMVWKDLGDAEKTSKTLVFWMKSLSLALLPPVERV